MKKTILLIIASLYLIIAWCEFLPPPTNYNNNYTRNTPSSNETRLINEGYTGVILKGSPLIWCSNDDSIFTSDKFEAYKNWHKIEWIICCGLLFKWCTIRVN